MVIVTILAGMAFLIRDQAGFQAVPYFTGEPQPAVLSNPNAAIIKIRFARTLRELNAAENRLGREAARRNRNPHLYLVPTRTTQNSA